MTEARASLILLTAHNAEYEAFFGRDRLPGLCLLAALDPDKPESEARRHAEALAAADIWLAEPGPAARLLELGFKPRWLQSTFAGVDALARAGLPRDYVLTRISGLFGPLMAEYVFGYLCGHGRRLTQYAQAQGQGSWRELPPETLQGRQFLTLGTGSIGAHLAATARLFGMRTAGINRSGRSAAGYDRCAGPERLTAWLSEADVVVCVVPATAATARLLEAEHFLALKTGAWFFNVGRGSLFDYDSLPELLERRRDLRVVLDVFPAEPLPPGHPLWKCPNVYITPHVSAPSLPESVWTLFADNYLRQARGQALEGAVDFGRGY